MTIDELKENSTEISCCYCGYSITTADLSDDDLQTLINTEHIPVDCSDCSGTYMIGIDLTVEPVFHCRECGDLGGWYEDIHVPFSMYGHSERWVECENCEGRKDGE